MERSRIIARDAIGRVAAVHVHNAVRRALVECLAMTATGMVRRAPGSLLRPTRYGLAGIIAVALALSALSLLTPSTLTHDAWWWLIWGRDLLHLSLDTRAGSSWKPFPVLLTTPFALSGKSVAPALWLVVARAGCLLAMVLVFRLGRRFAGWPAGVLAVVGLALMDGWLSEFRLGRSEGLMAAFVLWAVERDLDGRRDQALILCGLAALLRPDFWPLLGAYGIYVWIRMPRHRGLVAAIAILVPLLWTLPELWGSGDLLRASSAAQETSKGSAGWHAASEVLRFPNRIVVAPVLLGAVAAPLLAHRRGQRTVIVLFAATAAWMLVIAAMAAGGYPSLPRFAIPPMTVACLLAGIAFGWALAWASDRRLQLVAGGLAVAAWAPFAVDRWSPLRGESRYDSYRVALDRDLRTVVDRAGGPARVRRCSQRVVTTGAEIPALSWYLDGYRPIRHGVRRVPVVVFRARLTGSRIPRPRVEPGIRLRTIARYRRWIVQASCG
jgi:hypothetical protein